MHTRHLSAAIVTLLSTAAFVNPVFAGRLATDQAAVQYIQSLEANANQNTDDSDGSNDQSSTDHSSTDQSNTDDQSNTQNTPTTSQGNAPGKGGGNTGALVGGLALGGVAAGLTTLLGGKYYMDKQMAKQASEHTTKIDELQQSHTALQLKLEKHIDIKAIEDKLKAHQDELAKYNAQKEQEKTRLEQVVEQAKHAHDKAALKPVETGKEKEHADNVKGLLVKHEEAKGMLEKHNNKGQVLENKIKKTKDKIERMTKLKTEAMAHAGQQKAARAAKIEAAAKKV